MSSLDQSWCPLLTPEEKQSLINDIQSGTLSPENIRMLMTKGYSHNDIEELLNELKESSVAGGQGFVPSNSWDNRTIEEKLKAYNSSPVRQYGRKSILERLIACIWVNNKVHPTSGGAKKVLSCKSTGKKVTFTKDGKKVTRVVHENQRGTKVVKYNDEWILFSKLKM